MILFRFLYLPEITTLKRSTSVIVFALRSSQQDRYGFLSLRDEILKRLCIHGNKQEIKNCAPFYKNGEKQYTTEAVHITNIHGNIVGKKTLILPYLTSMATRWGCLGTGKVANDFFTAIKDNLPVAEHEVRLLINLPYHHHVSIRSGNKKFYF